MHVDLADLGFDQGGALLIKRALRSAEDGEELSIAGTAPELPVHLRAWCRAEGHSFRWSDGRAVVRKGSASSQRWSGAERAGTPDPTAPGSVVEQPSQRWGLAARGALVES